MQFSTSTLFTLSALLSGVVSTSVAMEHNVLANNLAIVPRQNPGQTCPAFFVITFQAPACSATRIVPSETLAQPRYSNLGDCVNVRDPLKLGLLPTISSLIASVIGTADQYKLEVFLWEDCVGTKKTEDINVPGDSGCRSPHSGRSYRFCPLDGCS